MKNKTIVIGIDGAHFELITPWLKEGSLPNIKKVIDNGISSDLDVGLPPVTSPNWKKYYTGKNPGKLGIFWWENINKKEKKVYYPAERKNKEKEIWDYLSEAGYKLCVIGTPLTYPPKKINGFFVSGGPDCSENDFTYPKSLEKELKEKFGYRIHPKHNIRTNKKKAVEEMYKIIDSRFKVAFYLMKNHDFDFIQIAMFHINTFHHFLWRCEETKKAWKIIDKNIGELLKKGDFNIIFMSDHGSNEIKNIFNINTWLNKEGYLKYNKRYEILQNMKKVGFKRDKIRAFLEKIGIKHFVKKIIPTRVLRSIPSSSGEIKREGKTNTINWDSSDAVASGQGLVYILKEDKKNEIKKKLIEISKEGKKIFKNVYEKEELYNGPYMDEAPDLILDQAENTHIEGGIGKKNVFDTINIWRAENKRKGIFMAFGPDFKKQEIEVVSILDLAPTILQIYGIKKPEDMDGKVLYSILKNTSETINLKNHQIEKKDDTIRKKEEDEVRKRLSDLGYIQ